MTLINLNGLPPDPDCLHCVVAEVIETFRHSHSDLEPSELICQLLQVIAEFIASTAPTGCEAKVAQGATRFLMTEVERARIAFQFSGVKPS